MDAQVNTHGSESLTQNINSAILPGKAEKMKEAAVSICDNYLWIRMPRELDHHTVSGIRKEADQKLMSSAVEHMVFDFAQTEFMDSSGIGMIVGRYKQADCLGVSVIVIHMNRRIRKLLQLAGLETMIEFEQE